jgi:hypothetical protein
MEQNLPPEAAAQRIIQLEEDIRRLQAELAALRLQQMVAALLETDGPLPRDNRTVVRTERGLTVNGTRLTLYSLMDGMKENNSLKNVRDIYQLTDEEMLDVLDYIHLHRAEVEAEYQEVVRSAEAERQHWEERNREHFAETYAHREFVQAKLREWQEQYRAESKP